MFASLTKKERFSKIKSICYGFLFAMFCITSRLFYLQVKQRVTLALLGTKNFMRTEVVPPLRGNLYDKNGVLLASNRPVFDLYWQGSMAQSSKEQVDAALSRIEFILGLKDCFFSRSSVGFAQKHGLDTLLKSDLSFEQLSKISEQCSGFSNLLVQNRFERVYPHKKLASHILGYLSRVEKIGCSGLEQLFEGELAGKNGYVMNVINSVGRPLEQRDVKKAQAGADITLNLDFSLQQVAESLFQEGQSGAFILMEPESGALRVFCSYPSFDPNVFLSPISEEDWTTKLSEYHPLQNRAIRSLYPPASIFKLVTLSAGLEEGVIQPESTFDCRGFVKFCGRKYFCKRRIGHGVLATAEGIAASCNVHCFEIGRMLKIDTFADYAFRFGLGATTGFLLPERSGLVPTSLWKRQAKKEQWWAGETLSASIGQSYLLVTPLQIARMVASVFTGYLSKPRILASELEVREPLRLSHRTLLFLRDAMKKVVTIGTAKKLSKIRDFDVYAKTGTAQTCALTHEKTQREHYEHGWVVAVFKYKDEKPLVAVSLLENTGTAAPGVDYMANFLRSYRTMREKEEQEGK